MREIEPNRGEGRALCPHSSPNWLFPQILVILAQFNHCIALLSGGCDGDEMVTLFAQENHCMATSLQILPN